MSLTLSQFQQRIRELFGAKDASRGIEGTFMWFMEEVGELSGALRVVASTPHPQPLSPGIVFPVQNTENGGRGEPDARQALALEFADVLAWLVTLANIADIDLDAAIEAKYGKGCPKCVQTPCICIAAKP